MTQDWTDDMMDERAEALAATTRPNRTLSDTRKDDRQGVDTTTFPDGDEPRTSGLDRIWRRTLDGLGRDICTNDGEDPRRPAG